MAGRSPDDYPGRWITVSEAVSYFRVSERTIRRRIATGLLPTKHESGRVLIYLYDKTPEESQAAPEGDKVTGDLQAENRRLQDLLSQVEGERDYLRQALATDKLSRIIIYILVEGERDYLRQALAAAMSKIPAIEAGAESNLDSGRTEKPRRWWWPWG